MTVGVLVLMVGEGVAAVEGLPTHLGLNIVREGWNISTNRERGAWVDLERE